MSANSECQFHEVRRGQWHYVLEDAGAPAPRRLPWR